MELTLSEVHDFLKKIGGEVKAYRGAEKQEDVTRACRRDYAPTVAFKAIDDLERATGFIGAKKYRNLALWIFQYLKVPDAEKLGKQYKDVRVQWGRDGNRFTKCFPS